MFCRNSCISIESLICILKNISWHPFNLGAWDDRRRRHIPTSIPFKVGANNLTVHHNIDKKYCQVSDFGYFTIPCTRWELSTIKIPQSKENTTPT